MQNSQSDAVLLGRGRRRRMTSIDFRNLYENSEDRHILLFKESMKFLIIFTFVAAVFGLVIFWEFEKVRKEVQYQEDSREFINGLKKIVKIRNDCRKLDFDLEDGVKLAALENLFEVLGDDGLTICR